MEILYLKAEAKGLFFNFEINDKIPTALKGIRKD
jgi:hypothetical protein